MKTAAVRVDAERKKGLKVLAFVFFKDFLPSPSCVLGTVIFRRKRSRPLDGGQGWRPRRKVRPKNKKKDDDDDRAGGRYRVFFVLFFGVARCCAYLQFGVARVAMSGGSDDARTPGPGRRFAGGLVGRRRRGGGGGGGG